MARPRTSGHVWRIRVLHGNRHSFAFTQTQNGRCASTAFIKPTDYEKGAPYDRLERRTKEPERTFERLSTKSLLRSIILGQIFKSPLLFKPGLRLLESIANSQSSILNVDKNPLIRAIILPLIYRHFCAGRNTAEVKQTITDIKAMGYSGIILCYSAEVMAKKDATGSYSEIDQATDNEVATKQIEMWRDGNLATLEAVDAGDYIGVKYTGAGLSISQALKEGKPPPPAMLRALHDLCDRAAQQKKQLWIDAEQQLYHPTIDKWTIDLMRKYNRNNGHALVLTTIQAYLKSSRATTEEYLRLAQKEGWTLGIKLVRGAYIASDIRSRIHDTKPDTDACYDSIVHDILTKTWPGIDKEEFPTVQLFIAGHNTTSVRKATMLVQSLAQKDQIDSRVCYGQIQGIADDIGCELLALGEQQARETAGLSEDQIRRNVLGSPRPFKCLTWGSLKDCMHYLVRRAIENQGAAERLNTGLVEMKRELRRRVLRF